MSNLGLNEKRSLLVPVFMKNPREKGLREVSKAGGVSVKFSPHLDTFAQSHAEGIHGTVSGQYDLHHRWQNSTRPLEDLLPNMIVYVRITPPVKSQLLLTNVRGVQPARTEGSHSCYIK